MIFKRRTPINVHALFENELRRRGVAFRPDDKTGCYLVETGDASLLVSLDNLERDIAGDGDTDRIARFVDIVIASAEEAEPSWSAERLYWNLEPNDYAEPADFRTALSDRIDGVLVHLSADGRYITWVTPEILDNLGLTIDEAQAAAQANLERALGEAQIETEEIDGVRLGFISTPLPFKSSFILAPNLQEVAGELLGWPLLAVAPDRDFLYLWAAKHSDFVQRVGPVVVREYSQAAYPLSTEVYAITNEEVQAIGEFPTGD